jgi:hypothetical protein
LLDQALRALGVGLRVLAAPELFEADSAHRSSAGLYAAPELRHGPESDPPAVAAAEPEHLVPSPVHGPDGRELAEALPGDVVTSVGFSLHRVCPDLVGH